MTQDTKKKVGFNSETAMGTLSIITDPLTQKSDRSRDYWAGNWAGIGGKAGAIEVVVGGEIPPPLDTEAEVKIPPPLVAEEVGRAISLEEVVGVVSFERKAPPTLLLFLLWVTPTATPTTTPTTTNATTTMIAKPLVVRYHGVDLELE